MSEGRKDDKGKTEWIKAPWKLFEKIAESCTKYPELRWDLLPFGPLERLVKILTFGAEKYEPNNWQKVDSERYFNALIRHLVADFIHKENADEESGLLHSSHANCNATFLDWQKTQKLKEENKNE